MRATLANFTLPPTGGFRLYDEIYVNRALTYQNERNRPWRDPRTLATPTQHQCCAILTHMLSLFSLIYVCILNNFHRIA